MEIESELINLFSSKRDIVDDEVHNLADKLGIEHSELENKIYNMLSDFWYAGKAKEFNGDYDPLQLEMGIKVEMEHTSNPIIAKRIAMDHLAEISDYYTRLDKMERDAGIVEEAKKGYGYLTIRISKDFPNIMLLLNKLNVIDYPVYYTSSDDGDTIINIEDISEKRPLLSTIKNFPGIEGYYFIESKNKMMGIRNIIENKLKLDETEIADIANALSTVFDAVYIVDANNDGSFDSEDLASFNKKVKYLIVEVGYDSYHDFKVNQTFKAGKYKFKVYDKYDDPVYTLALEVK